MTRSQRDNLFSIGSQKRSDADVQPAYSALHECCKSCLDLTFAGNFDNDKALPQCLCRVLHITALCLGFSCVRPREKGDGHRLGYKLTQQLESLRSQHTGDKHHPGEVTCGPVEAGDEAIA